MNVPASGDAGVVKVERRAATPIAGAIAGILFAVLFGVSTTLMNATMSGLSQDTGAWLETGAGQFKFALGLLPFAGLFFLWFIAVAGSDSAASRTSSSRPSSSAAACSFWR